MDSKKCSYLAVFYFGLAAVILVWLISTNRTLHENYTVKLGLAPINILSKQLKIVDSNISFTEDLPRHAQIFKILWYAHPTWVQPFRTLNNCEFKNCLISFNKLDIEHSDLVLFHHSNMNIQPPPKRKHHKWVFVSIESLPHTHKFYTYRQWEDKFDWTMTYRSDSEGYAPYGTIKPTINTKPRNYTYIFAKKTKDVAWLVSNCGTTSRRMEYVKRMQPIIQVDIFGKCGKLCIGTDCFKDLSNAYKFYLSFENTICEDYVTEKLFKNYNDDNNFVPVVRAAPNVKQLVPSNSFILASDFKSPEELALYLKLTGSNESIYNSYLQAKHKFVSIIDPVGVGLCTLCEKLNTKFERRQKLNLIKMLSEKPCFKPNDL